MMARDRAGGSTGKLALVWLLCVCLSSPSESLTTISSSPPPDEDVFTTITTTTIASTTEETTTSLAPSTERTSNAIPEEPLPKKHATGKKLDSPSADQLDKPYPYLKKSKEENAIRQAKRSGGDSLALNGTLQLSVVTKAPPSVESEVTTEAETVSTVREEDVVPTTVDGESTSGGLEDETTTRSARSTTETAASSEKSSVAETNTESVVPTTLSLSTSGISTTLATSTPATSTTGTATLSTIGTAGISTTGTAAVSTTGTVGFSTTGTDAVSSVADTNVPTTGAESLPTTVYEEPPTTTPEAEQSTIPPIPTITTQGLATLPPATTTSTTAEPTLAAASTRITSETTLLPATTLTTAPPTSTSTTSITTTSTSTTTSTTTTTTTTTAKPTTTISPRRVPATTLTPEPFSGAVTTVPDETPDTTTEIVSPTPAPEDVTLLVRIRLEGSWQEVCSKLPILRQSLTDLVNKNVEKKISPRQIIFHQTQCSESLTPTSLVSDNQLTPLLLYIVDENGNFDAKLTKLLPSLFEESSIDFPLKIHGVSLVPEADSGNAIAVIIVSCVAFICLILLAGLLFIMRKRQGRFNYGERCRPVSLDAYSLDSVSAYNSVRRSKAVVRSSKRSYGNPAFEDSSVTPTHPLNFAGLSTFCNDTAAVAEEFIGIPQIHSKIEELPPGAEIKNRYANVIPLPETRVPLQKINNDPLSEYINASYVRGPKNATKYYIACQAPTETTVADFWRMIWEQQCKVIIMLTDLVENGVDKCTEYIPPLEVSDCHRLYGDYQVTLKKREAKEKYAISTLHLKNLENNTFREVSHIWYLWPASGVPTDAAGLIAVLLEARALQRGAAGPILVHCSPGTGRTGTLIALDLCIRQYEVTRTVDVPRVVYTIRRDRAGAVQTREQYIFIYKGLNLYASKLAGGGIDST